MEEVKHGFAPGSAATRHLSLEARGGRKGIHSDEDTGSWSANTTEFIREIEIEIEETYSPSLECLQREAINRIKKLDESQLEKFLSSASFKPIPIFEFFPDLLVCRGGKRFRYVYSPTQKEFVEVQELDFFQATKVDRSLVTLGVSGIKVSGEERFSQIFEANRTQFFTRISETQIAFNVANEILIYELNRGIVQKFCNDVYPLRLFSIGNFLVTYHSPLIRVWNRGPGGFEFLFSRGAEGIDVLDENTFILTHFPEKAAIVCFQDKEIVPISWIDSRNPCVNVIDQEEVVFWDVNSLSFFVRSPQGEFKFSEAIERAPSSISDVKVVTKNLILTLERGHTMVWKRYFPPGAVSRRGKKLSNGFKSSLGSLTERRGRFVLIQEIRGRVACHLPPSEPVELIELFHGKIPKELVKLVLNF